MTSALRLPPVQMPQFDVTFYGASEKDHIDCRVPAVNTTDAIRIAAEQFGGNQMREYNWGVKVRCVDLKAEEERLAAWAPLYAERDDAKNCFVTWGFLPVVGTIWAKHPQTGLVAYVDEPEAPIGHRYAGIYKHTQDSETGKDVMTPWVLIPWYGDGADHDTAHDVLCDVLHTVTDDFVPDCLSSDTVESR